MKSDIHIILVDSSFESQLIQPISTILAQIITGQFVVAILSAKQFLEVFISCEPSRPGLYDFENVIIVVPDSEVSI